MGLEIAVIVISWNVRDYLANCLTSVYNEFAKTGRRGAVWVVDNGSTDGTQSLLAGLFPQTRLIQNEQNVGFGAANNQGMQAALAEDAGVQYFWLLNPDTVVRPGALRHQIECLENSPETGMVGVKLIYGDGRFQPSAFAFPGLTQLAFDLYPMPDRLYESKINGRYPRHLFQDNHAPFAVDMLLGASMLVRRDVAEATGGFDESFHMYCEEVDWCWRIRDAGWEIRVVPQAEVVHFGGESSKQVPAQSTLNLWRSRAQLYKKHHRRWKRYLAKRIAKHGLGRRAANAGTLPLKTAYQAAIDAWN